MIGFVIYCLRYVCVLLFGVFLSAAFLHIPISRKNTPPLCVLSALILAVQGAVTFSERGDLLYPLYPVVAHLPLVLLFMAYYKKRALPSVFAVTTAYMCCQICNYISLLAEALTNSSLATDAAYLLATLVAFPLLMRYAVPSVAFLAGLEKKKVISICTIPLIYYIFDYAATVYSDALYEGSKLVPQFLPLVLCILFLLFCGDFFLRFRREYEQESLRRLMEITYDQSLRKMELLNEKEQELSVLRHDMRHFLANIHTMAENENTAEICSYVGTLVEGLSKTSIQEYCANSTINIILSDYARRMEEQHIRFEPVVSISSSMRIPDVDITSILSNALENAISAVELLETGRVIELKLTEKGGKLLLWVSNSFAEKPELVDGMPVSRSEGHGLGTRSISYTAEKLGGNCKFSVTDDRFVLQVII